MSGGVWQALNVPGSEVVRGDVLGRGDHTVTVRNVKRQGPYVQLMLDAGGSLVVSPGVRYTVYRETIP